MKLIITSVKSISAIPVRTKGTNIVTILKKTSSTPECLTAFKAENTRLGS